MSDLSKLPVTVITGFLGAGKTTLIKHLIQNPQGKRLAVVVNEFGDVGVDGDILKSCAIPDCPAENIMELSNGCICCTVADDFIPTIEALMALEPRPDHILIETSGLALPKPLLKAFDWPDIRSKITVDGVIALADAEAVADGRFAPDVKAVDAQREADDSLDHETPLSEVFEDQISCADIILLTKTDLAGADGIAKARAVIDAEAPRPLPIVEISEGIVDPRVILGLEAAAEDDMDARRPITMGTTTTNTTTLNPSWSTSPKSAIPPSWSTASKPWPRIKTSCASKAMRPSQANPCDCSFKPWVRACVSNTTNHGAHQSDVGVWLSSPNMTT